MSGEFSVIWDNSDAVRFEINLLVFRLKYDVLVNKFQKKNSETNQSHKKIKTHHYWRFDVEKNYASCMYQASTHLYLWLRVVSVLVCGRVIQCNTIISLTYMCNLSDPECDAAVLQTLQIYWDFHNHL